MRLYLGYPESALGGECFKLKDLFLKEVSVDYTSVPVEVKKKLLSLLDNLEKKNYLFIGEVFYDAIDLLEFALFSVESREVEELLLPGYLYGKSTYLVRKLMKETFGKRVSVYYDFNLFSEKEIVLNIGYTRSSFSIGGKFLVIFPLGEFHVIDLLGNYLFNRFVFESGLSNTQLRKEGIRGKLLDDCRAQAARILFGRSKSVIIDDFNYKRSVTPEEISSVLSPIIGRAVYGDWVEKAFDFSSLLVLSLYRYEELFRERPKILSINIIGRLTFPFEEALSRNFPVKIRRFNAQTITSLPVKNKNFKITLRNIPVGKDVSRFSINYEKADDSTLETLRAFYLKRNLKGLSIIEELSQKKINSEEKEKFIYELISILKRSSFRTKKEIAYINYDLAALTKLEIPKHLFAKVLREIEDKAFNWLLPFETKINILYFCYENAEKLRDTKLEVFPALMLSYIRDKKITEGEKNFIRTVAEAFYGTPRK